MFASRILDSRAAALWTLSLALLITQAPPVMAVGRGDYSMEILVDGAPVAEYLARGAVYVEALPSREYAIRLRNNTGQRVAIALSVDGLNSIDAKSTSSREASKWILDPYQTITIDGWQVGPSTARRFFFTTEARSYGAWLGETRNLGVVTAAVFRERRTRPAPIWRQKGSSGEPEARPESSTLNAPRGDAPAVEAQPRTPDDYAATGIGQEVGHVVTRVRFDAEPSPAAVLNVRYEYRDALVRLGVLAQPDPPCRDLLARRERARGFEEMDFAPDPYRPRCP